MIANGAGKAGGIGTRQMEWHDGRSARVLLTGALLAAALLGGCFQPLYGERSATGSPALRQALSGVLVDEIPAPANSVTARLAVQIRNDLLFNFTGGGHSADPTHRLKIQIRGASQVLSQQRSTGIPSIQNYVLNASYSLTEVASGKNVVSGNAVTTVSNNPAGTQRFATIAGMQDAESRAAKDISEAITTRLASYFVSGI
jgi:LPS-assembly lipoprotein